MWIYRNISDVLQAKLKARPAAVLTGARQVGKSSVLRVLLPNHTYVSLDLPSAAAAAEEDPTTFLMTHPPPVIIDEVQYAPALFRHLKIAIDANRSAPEQFVLTGSQRFSLMQGLTESLAGRISVQELETLSYSEVKHAFPDVSVEDFIVRGGFPELWAQNLDTQDFHRDYVATYLERDVRTLMRVSSLRDFNRFLRAGAARSAQLLNKAEWARDVGISPSTAQDWLSVMQASSQAFLLEPWFTSRSRSITKSPKFYFADTGTLCFLLGIHSVAELVRSPHLGAIWETWVYSELRKRMSFKRDVDPLWFFRDRGLEVDFLIHRGGRFELYEAKWSENPRPRDAEPMSKVAEKLGNVDQRTMICRTPNTFPLADGTRVVGVTGDWLS